MYSDADWLMYNELEEFTTFVETLQGNALARALQIRAIRPKGLVH